MNEAAPSSVTGSTETKPVKEASAEPLATATAAHMATAADISAPIKARSSGTPTDLRSHFSSMAVGTAYGVMGTVINLIATTAMTMISAEAGALTFAGGMAYNLYAASKTKVPRAGVLSAMFGGVAVVGGVVLSGAMALSGALGALDKPSGGHPVQRPKSYDIINVPAPVQCPTTLTHV